MSNVIQRGLVKAANVAGRNKTVVTISPKRTEVDEKELFALVCKDVAAKIQAGHPFTAYEVTLSLRNANPTLNIPHVNGVREIVHDLSSRLNMPRGTEPTKGGATLFFPDVAPDAMQLVVFESDANDIFDLDLI